MLDNGTKISNNQKGKRINLFLDTKEDSIPEAEEITTQLQEICYDHRIDAQIFANKELGPSGGKHKDEMDVILVPILGDIQVCGKKVQVGNYLWIPRGMAHDVVFYGRRITLSFGVVQLKSECIMNSAGKDTSNPIHYYFNKG